MIQLTCEIKKNLQMNLCKKQKQVHKYRKQKTVTIGEMVKKDKLGVWD